MEQFLLSVWKVLQPLAVDYAAAVCLGLGYYALAAVKTWVAGLKDARLKVVAEIAVNAAEQKYGDGNGEQKYAWVTGELRKRGLPADEAHIENAVRSLQSYVPWMGNPADAGGATSIPAASAPATTGGS